MTTSGLTPGTRVGRYEILGEIGRGGMGQVFRARDTTLRRDVAIKALPPDAADRPEWLARLKREAITLAALNHPNIVTVHAIEALDSHSLIVMEFVDGKTLHETIDAHPQGLPLADFATLAFVLTEAVGAAHDRGVVHRDLKPTNVMVGRYGLKVLDFGLAKHAADEVTHANRSTAFSTSPGVLLGTLQYMSPEQVDGLTVDARSDVFALGVMMYEMLSHTLPFPGNTISAILNAITNKDPAPLGTLRAGLPDPLVGVIGRCLAKNPHDRFRDSAELHAALVAAAAMPAVLPAPSGERARDASTAAGPGVLHSRVGLTGVLAATFAVNWIETTLDPWFSRGSEFPYQMASAFSWMEGNLSFEFHDLTNPLGVYAAAIAYFFVPISLLTAMMVILWKRRSISPYRVLALSILLTYAIGLPFYLFLPVPERWSIPSSDAVMLSDLWSTRLIETIRPVSGIDNCFPSFHVGLTVDLALVAYLFKVRFWPSVAFLGLAVILSTVFLGIHWLPDVVAGLAAGVVSVAVARRWDDRLRRTA